MIVLFGSGETAASSQKVYDWLLQRLISPARAAVLETPAGFEPNSAGVAEQVAEFLQKRLQNYRPQVTVVPARKRGTPFSPDDPALVEPLWSSNLIFLGPGSPTYAVRQLQDSLAWHTLVARHRAGAALVLASAASIAASLYALPVYEIYKVGEDLHWHWGLDLLGAYGLSLVFVPHWDNTDGGRALDTSRCYMGQARFDQLLALLPPQAVIVGLAEHTALVLDLAGQVCRVMGRGEVTVWSSEKTQSFYTGQSFPITELGPFHLAEPQTGLPPEVWARTRVDMAAVREGTAAEPNRAILALVAERETARAHRDWATADALRAEITARGWRLLDTGQGPRLEPLSQE